MANDTPVLLVPRFVHDLNAIVAKAGLSVSVEEAAGNLCAIWHGTQKQMRATGLLTPGYRFPYGRCPFYNAMISGSIIVESPRSVRAEILCGGTPRKIENKGDIEIIHYQHETAYHGTLEALVTSRVCEKSQLPYQKRRNKQNHWWSEDCQRSEARRLPDEKYLFTIETVEAFKARQAEEEHDKRARDEKQKDYKSPEEWLEEFEDMIVIFARTMLSAKYCSAKTKAGMRYSVNPAHFSAILNDIECAAQRIRDVPVKVESLESTTPEARDKAASASSDAQFQRFLQRATGH